MTSMIYIEKKKMTRSEGRNPFSRSAQNVVRLQPRTAAASLRKQQPTALAPSGPVEFNRKRISPTVGKKGVGWKKHRQTTFQNPPTCPLHLPPNLVQ